MTNAIRLTAILAVLTLALAGPALASDTWVFLGDSLTVGMVGDGAGFVSDVREKFGVQIRAVNTSRVGKHVTEYVNEIDGILARNPEAKYFPFLIGANDVCDYSASRATWLRGKLVTVLDKIVAAGRTPILMRLSFRRKNGDPLAPFNTNVYDPLIRRYCPRWFDESTGRGRVDLHTFLKNNANYLAGDGIHYTGTGYREARRQVLVDVMAAAVYGSGASNAGSAASVNTGSVELAGVTADQSGGASTGSGTAGATTAGAAATTTIDARADLGDMPLGDIAGTSTTGSSDPTAPTTVTVGTRIRALLAAAERTTAKRERTHCLLQVRALLELFFRGRPGDETGYREVAVYQRLVASLGIDPGATNGVYGKSTRVAGLRLAVAMAQNYLAALGFNPGIALGYANPETQEALNRFRASQGRPASTQPLGPADLAALSAAYDARMKLVTK